jgi:hypothetical protein
MTSNLDTTITAPEEPKVKTLQEELSERMAAERREARAVQTLQAEQNQAKWDAEHAAETQRAERVIAKVREAILAPTRSTWKRVMTLELDEVIKPGAGYTCFAPYPHTPWHPYRCQVAKNADAAQQVLNYCRDNRISVRLVASFLESDLVDARGQVRKDAEPDSFCLQVAYLGG